MHQWKKLGRLYNPADSRNHPKLASHAANPLPVFIENDTFRVYYSGRDSKNRSSVGAVDIDIIKQQVVREHRTPFFENGSVGSFFADGVSIGNCYTVNDITYMLFMGWQSPTNDHWRGEIGRLILRSDFSLELDSEIPFMSVDRTDPVSLSYPWVINTDDSSYQMYYGSTRSWDSGNGEMVHVINYATSLDGKNWKRQGLGIPYKEGVAQAFSRPTVIGDRSRGYEMWFSYRGGNGTKYRIGYAHSHTGRHWELDPKAAGIDVSKKGWDSEMIEYPYVFVHKKEYYMMYNGNGYGQTGFGLARLERK